MTIERATPDPRTLSPVALVDGTDDEVIAQPGDSQRMLALAESLQARLYVQATQRFRLRVGLMVSFAIWASMLFVLSVGVGPSATNQLLLVLMTLLIGGTTIALEYVVYDRTQKVLVRLRRSLREVVTLLRESEQTLAVQEHWSAMQRAEFRIRLSQFDIAP